MSKHGKKYLEVSKKIDPEKMYSLEESIDLLKSSVTTKFDPSCEAHFNLDLDVKKADQQIRTTVVLPNGTGKTKRVVAFVPDDKINEAKEAGAIEAGNELLFEKLEKGWVDFDVAVSSPDMMRALSKYGKLLGTKGLMPNPKAGTVTPEVGKAVKEIMGGKIELKTDSTGIVHLIFGKASFDKTKLQENLDTLIKAIKNIKPSGAKGKYVISISISTAMGPGIKLDTSLVKN